MKNTKRDDFWAAKAEIVSQFLAGADDVSTMIAPLLSPTEYAASMAKGLASVEKGLI